MQVRRVSAPLLTTSASTFLILSLSFLQALLILDNAKIHHIVAVHATLELLKEPICLSPLPFSTCLHLLIYAEPGL